MGRPTAVPQNDRSRPHIDRTPHMIAVGTDIAASPPHRSQRALLAHWAPASGGGVEPSIREGVRYAGRWQPLGPETSHALPVQSRALAAASQRSVPVPCAPGSEPIGKAEEVSSARASPGTPRCAAVGGGPGGWPPGSRRRPPTSPRPPPPPPSVDRPKGLAQAVDVDVVQERCEPRLLVPFRRLPHTVQPP